MADVRTPQDDFNDLVKNLIQTTEVQDFNGALLAGLENQTPDFWRYLVNFMYNEYKNSYLGHAPIEETDFPENAESFVEWLNNNIDIDKNGNWNIIWSSIKENVINGENPIWNESIKKIIQGFINAFDVNGKIYIKGNEENDGVYISILDIMRANAGNRFDGNSDTNDWVVPNINIDGNTYGEVRQKDKIISVLNNPENLQYTNGAWAPAYLTRVSEECVAVYTNYSASHKSFEEAVAENMTQYTSLLFDYWGITLADYKEILDNGEGVQFAQNFLRYAGMYPDKPVEFADYPELDNFFKNNIVRDLCENLDVNYWIRLLMPEYLRRVEVEDLNRNFWVLGQTTTAICSFLFGPDAPFAKLFEDMAAEITQLWENILYLWLAYAMITQKEEVTDIHTEILYLPISEVESYLKFDNFDEGSIIIDSQFWDKVKQRCDYIVKSHPDSHVIIAPKIRIDNYKHNYYSKEIFPGLMVFNRNSNTYNFCKFVVSENGDTTDGVVIDAITANHFNLCWAIKENEFTYEFVPADEVASQVAYKDSPYYILLRTSCVISSSYNTQTHLINLNGITIKAKDVAATFCLPYPDETIDTYEIVTGYNEGSSTITFTHAEKTARGTIPDFDPSNYPYEVNISLVKKGYYQGELVSWLAPLGTPTEVTEVSSSD